ncbi:hypothetical protein B0J13DRAFT_621090 [Dactylonectria estremocensis]|uniref:Uncharacterized protein n=1 Tax=Dactylonectria estremocensis TaxID=1079267 RepID=A0A9P9EZ54_9HYPO|nr:hypothetical protein B0J13DRAFT_621090 [Dactylonectria estremocensis]
MSDNVSPRIVEAACMADLSRMRQEELPLSNVEKRGPSFNPNGKNGTSHYGAKFKQDLTNKWQTEFDDEEARQIDGLNAENARPWATNVESQAPAHAAVGGASSARRPQPSGPAPSAKRPKLHHQHGQTSREGANHTEFRPVNKD